MKKEPKELLISAGFHYLLIQLLRINPATRKLVEQALEEIKGAPSGQRRKTGNVKRRRRL